jgi:predicted RNase H-like HicB family nuclease
MVADMRRTYTAVAERADGWWAITVLELRGVFSQARRLAAVEPMARDAIAVFLDVSQESFDVEVREALAPEVQRVVTEAIRARSEALDQQRVATHKSREAIGALERLGLPQRDIGRLLHLSHQRVAQLREPWRDADHDGAAVR